MRKIIPLSLILIFPLFAHAQSYDFYVDKNFRGAEHGTQENPFRTIGSAIEKAEHSKPGIRRIFIFPGEYEETINLSDSIKLFGESKENTTLKVAPLSTINLAGNNFIKNLTITGGTAPLTIHGSAFIVGSTISGGKNKGINIVEGKSFVVIKNTNIINNGGKGLYVQKGNTILLTDNIATGNQGEGFDIRQNISGVITGNNITNNSESGIEILSSGSDVLIRNNAISNNLANGIANQSYPEMPDLGKIKIYGNALTGNGKYGIYCGAPSGGTKTKTFFSESIALENNSNAGNTGKPVSGSCHLERQTSDDMKNISTDIETRIQMEADLHDQFYAFESAIDSNITSGKNVVEKISDMGLLDKIFFGVSQQDLAILNDSNLELQKHLEKLPGLSGRLQNESMKNSIAVLASSAKEAISLHDATIKKSLELNAIFWLPIRLTSIWM